MNLYVWGGDDKGATEYRRDWSNGLAVVLAASVDDARSMLLKQVGYDHEDLDREPRVFPITEPVAFEIAGGS